MCVFSGSVVSSSLGAHGLQPAKAPVSMGFSRQEYWSGQSFLFPGDLPDPGIKPLPPASPSLEGGFFTTGDCCSCSVSKLYMTLGDPKDCSMPGPPVPHRFRSSPKFKFWSPAGGIFLMIACTTRGKGKPKDKVCGIPYFSRCSLDWSMPPPSASRLVSLVRRRVSSGMLPSCPVAQVVVIGNQKEERPFFFSHLCLSTCYSSLPFLCKTCVQSSPHSLTFSPTHQQFTVILISRAFS